MHVSRVVVLKTQSQNLHSLQQYGPQLTQCGPGTYSHADRASTSLTCKTCPMFSDSPAGSAALEASTCNVGYSGNANTIRGRCAACLAGKYKSAARNGDCTACGAGKYGIATGQTAKASCTVCGEGLLKANKRARMIQLRTDLITMIVRGMSQKYIMACTDA